MNNDRTLINKLWWLRKFLNDHFEDNEYKAVINMDLSVDIVRKSTRL